MSTTPDEIMKRALSEEPSWPQSADGAKIQDPLRQIALELARLNGVMVQIGTLMAEAAKIDTGRMRIEAELLALITKQQESSMDYAKQTGSAFGELTQFLTPFLEKALDIANKPRLSAVPPPAADPSETEHVAESRTARIAAVPGHESEREVEIEDPPA